jgi:2-haloalkanoic acid dehalogenase type II
MPELGEDDYFRRAAVPRAYGILTFDCYGTLIDWEAGISEAFLAAARQDDRSLSRDAVLSAYAELEPVVQAERYLPYREVLAETAGRVAARLGWELTRERAAFLPASLPGWPPFPDTNPALERLVAAGCRLGILSNVDDDLLAGTRRLLTVPFDLIVTAQQVGSYKPAAGHFLAARQAIGEKRWLHVAQSYFHDVVPARALGVPTAWINRKHERAPDGGQATLTFDTLAAFATWIMEGER